jgi:hypothetical protein
VSSFDRPRPRPAPSSVTGHTLNGDDVMKTLDVLTLIVAIKQSCDGCLDFVTSPLEELNHVAVLIVSATDDLNGEWADAQHDVVVSPELLVALGIRWPPFYVLVDPETQRVVTEGVVFAPAQVAEEIAAYLAP